MVGIGLMGTLIDFLFVLVGVISISYTIPTFNLSKFIRILVFFCNRFIVNFKRIRVASIRVLTNSVFGSSLMSTGFP